MVWLPFLKLRLAVLLFSLPRGPKPVVRLGHPHNNNNNNNNNHNNNNHNNNNNNNSLFEGDAVGGGREGGGFKEFRILVHHGLRFRV